MDEEALTAGERHLVVIFFLGLLVFLLLLSGSMLRDPDTYWHLAAGAWIREHGAVPRLDTFSHTFAGEPWIAKEWLSQLLMDTVYRLAGWRGVAFFTAAAVALALSLLLAFMLRRLKASVALALVLLVLPLLAGSIVARPQVLFFLLLVVWTGGLLRAAECRVPPGWWLLGVMVLWTNLHATFPLGLAIAALIGVEACIAARPADRMRIAGRWFLFGVATLAATGLTPYGYRPLLVSLEFVGGNEGLPYISEWQPFRPGLAQAFTVVALLGALALSVLPRRNPLRFLPVMFCGYLMARHARFTGLFAIVAVMALAGPLARRFPALGRPAGREVDARAGRAPALVAAALAAAIIAVLALGRPAPDGGITPAEALDAALSAGASGPIFNEYDFGGYLIFRGVPTFTDGRNDQIYRGGFTVAYFETQRAADDAGFLGLLDRYGITWALLRPGSEAAAKLTRAGWRRVHEDDIAVVYLR